MKKIFFFTLTLLFIYLSCLTVLAHPGRTDSNGGHYNRSTGEYHYHHGYSAHQHPNGECPYDFDDKTDHNSSSGGSVTTTTYPTIKSTIQNTTDSETKESTDKNSYIKYIIGGISVALITAIFYIIYLRCNIQDIKSELSSSNWELKKTTSLLEASKKDCNDKAATIIELHSHHNKLKEENEFLLKKIEEKQQLLSKARNDKYSALKVISKLRSNSEEDVSLFYLENYIYSSTNNDELNDLCEKFCTDIANIYTQKGYTVNIITNNFKFEKYIEAKSSKKILLIQCAYTANVPYLNEASVVALYSTTLRLDKSYKKLVKPILITNATLTPEARQFANRLGLIVVENFNPEKSELI